MVSDSPGLADFAIGLVNSALNWPDGQVKFFLRNSNYRRTVKSILLIKKFLGLVEITFGLVFASLSLETYLFCFGGSMNNSGALLISLTLFCFSVIHVDLEIHGTTIWAIRDLIAAFSLIIKLYLAGHEVNLRPSALLSRFFSKHLKTYNHTSD